MIIERSIKIHEGDSLIVLDPGELEALLVVSSPEAYASRTADLISAHLKLQLAVKSSKGEVS